MRRYLLVFGVLAWLTISMCHANTTLEWDSSSFTEECPKETIGGRIAHGMLIEQSNAVETAGTTQCETHYFYGSNPRSFTRGAGATSCPSGQRVSGWNGTDTIYCQKYDDNPPSSADVTNNNPDDLLANDHYPYVFSINDHGQAPITLVEWFKENKEDESLSFWSSTLSPWRIDWDISNVDQFRLPYPKNYREASFRITKICDEAGNCWNGPNNASNPLNRIHNIFSNSLTFQTKSLDAGDLADRAQTFVSGGGTADGASYPVTARITDVYGNAIVPASNPKNNLYRTIDFNFLTTNTLYLDQFRLSGQSFFISPPTGSANQNFPFGINKTTSFTDQYSSDGSYPFGVKAYTPTGDSFDLKGTGSLVIHNGTSVDINGWLGTNVGQPLSIPAWWLSLYFKPLYYTSISWDIRSAGFTEGIRQDSFLWLWKHSSRTPSWPLVQLTYSGSSANLFKMYGGTSTNHASAWGIRILGTPTNLVNSMDFWATWTPFYTFLAQNPLAVARNSKTYLSTHISYVLDGLNVVYNSDIVGKWNYWSSDYIDPTQQMGAKVLGLVHTKNSQSLTVDQIPTDVGIFGNIDKFTNKTQIIKNATAFLRNVSTADQSILTINKTRLSGGTGYGKYITTNTGGVLYFWDLKWGNVTLGDGWSDGGNLPISGKRTILIVGGNLYIKSNLYYSDPKSLLGIIVLKDSAGRGGNLYIDPRITNIVGSIYSQNSILSYDGTRVLGPETSLRDLKNQLHIFGNVFSENTIGGSRKSPPTCPYFVNKWDCDLPTAQRYDLNYLRRYYLVNQVHPYSEDPINNPAKVIGGGTCDTSGACTAPTVPNARRSFSNSKIDQFGKYPVIIEYNSLYRTTQPPLFTLDRK